MKIISVLFCFLFLSCASPTSQVKTDVSNNIKYANEVTELSVNSTFTILASCLQTRSVGSGFLINKNMLVTAKHVVDCDDPNEASEVFVMTYFKEMYDVSTVIMMPDLDLAILVLKEKEFTRFFELSKEPLMLGEPVCMRTGIAFAVKCGEVVRIDGDRVYTTLDVKQGDSGSPVYDKQGHIRGHVTSLMVYANGSSLGVFLPATSYFSLIF